jgi:collagen type III alpha
MVRHLREQGLAAAARAIVKGNRIKAEVVLYASRAHQLPESWLGAGGQESAASPVVVPGRPSEHGPIPPMPTGIAFVVPPGWPSPPAGWVPPPGWRPDPAWPVAPVDWQWWVPIWK